MKRQPTEIGKILRKLRADKGETAKDMAKKLGITASYLSAIELGKRRMTEEIQTQIIFMYELSADDRKTITRASADKPLKLDLLGATAAQIEVARLFAKWFRKLDSETLQQIAFFISMDITRKQPASEKKFQDRKQ